MHDPNLLIFRRAIRVAIVLPLTYLFVANVLKLGPGAPYAVFGTFALLGFADFGGPTRDRARAYLLTGAAGLVTITIGTLAATTLVSAVVTTLVVGFAVTFSGVMRGYVAAASTSVLLPFIIAVTAGPGLPELWQRLAAFAVAVVISTAAALLMWPVHQRSELRLRVAQELNASAAVLRSSWGRSADDAADSAADAATRIRQLVEANHRVHDEYDGQLRRPGSATARDRALLQLVDQLDRVRTFLCWRIDDPGASRLPADQTLARMTAGALRECAAALTGSGVAPDSAVLGQARDEHRMVMTAWATDQLERGQVETVETAMVGSFQVRLVALHAQLIARHTRIATGAPPEPDPDSVPNTWAADGSAGSALPPARMLPGSRIKPSQVLRNQLNLGSPWFRNSLRAALALAIAVGVVNNGGVDHGFWVVLGTLTALRFDAMGTGRTAVAAIVGTCAGFVVGTLVLMAVGDHTSVYWVLLPIAAFLSGYTPGAISLMVGQASFTVFVIVFYGILQGPDVRTGETRVVDVAIGLSISLLVSALMWPRGVMARVSVTLARSVEQASVFLVAAYDRLLQGPAAQDRVVAARAEALQSLDVANETFDLATSQSGAAPLYTQAWSSTANAAGEIVACADLVRLLAVNGHAPGGCPEVADLMISSVHYVQTQMNAAVSHANYLRTVAPTEYADAEPPRTLVDASPIGNPLPRLERAVTECLTSWHGQSPIPNRSTGDLATSTVWAQDWLVYMCWLAQRIARITQPPKDPAVTTEPGSADARAS